MSEYQYYEFRLLEGTLTDEQQEKLRSVSTRGRITRTSFTNEYSFGDFRGNPVKWMEKYFDIFFYYANWGDCTFMIRLPEQLIDKEEVEAYAIGNSLQIRYSRGNVIFGFHSSLEECYEIDGEENSSLEDILPLREEIEQGDFRSLYLGWLLAVQHEEIDDEILEPSVPDGLDCLSSAQRNLVEFLHIDELLLKEAQKASKPRLAAKNLSKEWIRTLSEKEKNNLLLDTIDVYHKSAGINRTKAVQRYLMDIKNQNISKYGKRTVGQLREAANICV